MIGNIDLGQLFLFPVKDNEARRNFIITSLVYLASFIIPILPLIAIMGYTARIMRQVVNGEEPHMTVWDDWESILKDGLYLFGVRMIYMLPVFVIVIPLSFGMSFLPLWMDSNQGSAEQFIGLNLLLFAVVMLLIFPISLALGIIVPAAETHTIVNNDFAAGFRVREWWVIFRANWSGFLLAYIISLVASMVLSSIVGIAMITIVLICLLPFIMPAITAYLTLVMYAAFAHAYKEGKAKLQQPIANSQ